MRRRSIFRLIAARDGVAGLEFALLAMPFMMLVFGTVEFGRLIWIRQAIEATATQGARCMGMLASSCADAASSPPTNTISYIESVASGWGITLTSSNLTPAPTTNGTGACAGLSQVSISYTFQSAVSGVLTMLSGGKPLTVQVCFPNQV